MFYLSEAIGTTHSLCPECFKKIEAKKYIENDKVFLEKSCEEHGEFKTIISHDSDFYERMENFEVDRSKPEEVAEEVEDGCPQDCGLCPEHSQHTCIAVIEVTERCNMSCDICFANSNEDGDYFEPSLEKLREMYETVLEYSEGSSLVQISGGEPTIRDDLPTILQLGRDVGIDHIELNTNGYRIAKDKEFFSQLSDNIDSIYLSFDGTNDEVYEKRYGRPFFDIKKKAIKRCGEEGIGVTLVPTLAADYNLNQVGEIIEFAKNHVPTVNGVHFQPVSLFGRSAEWVDQGNRVDLSMTTKEIEKQTEGEISVENFTPTSCPSVHCDVSSLAILDENNQLMPLTDQKFGASGEVPDIAEKTKSSVEKRWRKKRKEKSQGKENKSSECCSTTEFEASSSCCDSGGWEEFVKNAADNYLTISIMDFQDAWNVETDRVQKCCIHVVTPDNRLIPFCNFNLTDKSGNSLYRDEVYSDYR